MSPRRRSTSDFAVARTWRRLRWLYLAILGAIGAVLALGERLDALARSKVWMYGYVVVDLFKIEIIALVVLLFVWDLSAAPWLRQRSAIVGIVVLCLVALTVYEGRFYFAGKGIYLREYPKRLVRRAEAAFAQHDVWLAEVHLSACQEVFRSALCAEVRRRLQLRVRQAQRLRDYLRNVPPGTPPAIDVLETAYLLDRDRLLYEQHTQEIERAQRDLTGRYTEAIGLIHTGEIRAARSALEAVQRTWQGFGDCHLIIRELATLQSLADVDAERAPYVAAVKRYGPDAFVRRTLKLDRPRPPDTIIRDGPGRLMFVGVYSE